MIAGDEERAPGVFGMFAQEIQQGQAPKGKGLQKVHREAPAAAPVSVISPPSPSAKPKPAQKIEADAADDTIYYVNPEDVTPWELADRPEDEFGDMNELTESIRAYGQEIPALLRPIAGSVGKYELIYGRRRWTACLDLGTKLKAFIRAMDDEEAFKRMYIENAKRNDLSAWAKAMSWQRAIDKGIYKTETALAAKLGIHRGTVNNIMAFTRIPKEVVQAIGKNMKSIGIHTAKALSQLETPEEIAVAVELAEKIGAGAIVAENVTKAIKARVSSTGEEPQEQKSRTITDDKGAKLFTVRTTGRGVTEFTFTSEAIKRASLDDLILKVKGIF